MADQNKVGRPLKFVSVDELQRKIEEYFETCDNHTRPYVTKEGEIIQIPDPKPYTITGLALALDTTRQGLINYEQRDEYYDTIRRAKLKIENYAEESLWQPKIATGVIFNLKNNFAWIEKQELDNNIANKDGKPFEIRDTLSQLSVEELRKLASIE